MITNDQLKLEVIKTKCEEDHLFFCRYFFKHRQGVKFRVNWHHQLIAEAFEKVVNGEIENLIINIPPGSSKTEIISINGIARGIALNPKAKFLHISYSDDLSSTNSQAARELVESSEFQELWPMNIAVDSKAKKKWNVTDDDGKTSGGCYAVALGGQITGFRAGRMIDGFQGIIIIDDPLKPEDAFSKTKRDVANRRLLSTVTSRRANPKTPIVIIMQRLSENDPSDFAMKGNLGLKFETLIIPAIIDDDYVSKLPEHIQKLVDSNERDEKGRFSYWPYKEPIHNLVKMETGAFEDKDGSRMSRHVFAGQYGQHPTAIGGNLIHGEHFIRYKWDSPPKIKSRMMIADTASKTKERNDFTVFEVWGETFDNKLVLLDVLRGKWEAPELLRRAIAFWKKHTADQESMGVLRYMWVEDKSSGTGLIQTLRSAPYFMPMKEIQRNVDKYTRCLDAQPFIESGCILIPEDAPWTSDFITEAEAFTADGTHAHDDQLDPLFDAIEFKYIKKGTVSKWESFAQANRS